MLNKRKSKIHGFGIFPSKEIKKNKVFYKVSLNKILIKPRKKCAYIGRGKWVSDRVLNYVNHSCSPNSKLILGKKPYLKSIKKIKKGEEITVNYNLTEKGNKKIKCNCKSKNCKGFFKIKCI
jgi:SET domain-containing protein